MESKALTLQQRMVKVRAEIPALVKRAYSDDVNYDFTKIDDIFRFLTPALNRWGINLDVVSECATKKDEKGNPIFVEYLNQCQLWFYETDTTFQWTNADNPEDHILFTLHPMGTHEMPEKARASAWTFALKCYYIHKFCIDQGAEDSDMVSNHPVPEKRYEEDYQTESGYAEDSDQETYDGPYDGAPEEAERNYLAAAGDGEEADDNIMETDDSSEEAADSLMEAAGDSGEVDDNGMEAAGDSEEADDNGMEAADDSEEAAGNRMEKANGNEAAAKAAGGGRANKAAGAGSAKNHAAKSDAKIPQDKKNEEQARPAPSRHIRPESGTMVKLPDGVGTESDQGLSVEDASEIVCKIGIYNNKRMGELLELGGEGIKALEWFAYDYRGRNETLRQAARVLLNTVQAA